VRLSILLSVTWLTVAFACPGCDDGLPRSAVRIPPVGFDHRPGWSVGKSDAGPSADLTAVAVNERVGPVRSVEDAVRRLSADGVLVAATTVPTPTSASVPSLKEAAAYLRSWNAQPLYQRGLSGKLAFFTLARIKRITAFVRVYFGSERPSVATMQSARGQILALRLSGAPMANPVAGAAPLVATPPRPVEACERLRLLRPTCPRLLPVGPFSDFHEPADLLTAGRVRAVGPITFSFSWWAESPPDPAHNRPPRFLHLVIWARKRPLTRDLVGFAWPDPAGPIALDDGVYAGHSDRGHYRDHQLVGASKSVSFGFVDWCGNHGSLTLVSPADGNGLQSGHLIFHWRSGSIDRAIGIHGWEPFTETVATLEGIVCSAKQR
jgi:hypothetical protein